MINPNGTPRKSLGIYVAALVLLTSGCAANAAPNDEPQVPVKSVEVSQAAIAALFEVAYVGTADRPGCLWGKAYDTAQHIGERDLVPSGYAPAIPLVSNSLKEFSTFTYLHVTPRGNDETRIILNAQLTGESIVFTPSEPVSRDIIATVPCPSKVVVPIK